MDKEMVYRVGRKYEIWAVRHPIINMGVLVVGAVVFSLGVAYLGSRYSVFDSKDEVRVVNSTEIEEVVSGEFIEGAGR